MLYWRRCRVSLWCIKTRHWFPALPGRCPATTLESLVTKYEICLREREFGELKLLFMIRYGNNWAQQVAWCGILKGTSWPRKRRGGTKLECPSLWILCCYLYRIVKLCTGRLNFKLKNPVKNLHSWNALFFRPHVMHIFCIDSWVKKWPLKHGPVFSVEASSVFNWF